MCKIRSQLMFAPFPNCNLAHRESAFLSPLLAWCAGQYGLPAGSENPCWFQTTCWTSDLQITTMQLHAYNRYNNQTNITVEVLRKTIHISIDKVLWSSRTDSWCLKTTFENKFSVYPALCSHFELKHFLCHKNFANWNQLTTGRYLEVGKLDQNQRRVKMSN